MSATVELLTPTSGPVALEEVLASVGSAPTTAPFHPATIDFLAEFSLMLGRRATSMPEVRALAYWLRRAELRRHAQDHESRRTRSVVDVPRGTVVHFPPSNVDTMFVYSWALSVLVGNRNIVRVSSRRSDKSDLIVECLREVMANHPQHAAANAMITYERNDAITRMLSAQADVRVIWGGDETVRTIRALPIAPHATELTFADRRSLAAIDVRAYDGLTEPDRDSLAERFFNDVYFFDQMGCSSPRVLVWVGQFDGAIAEDFLDRLERHAVEKGYLVDAGASLSKLGQAHRSILDSDVSALRPSSLLTVVTVQGFPEIRDAFPGGGFLYQLSMADLLDLAPAIRRSDQTLAVFGLSARDVAPLVSELNGRGIDRIVPIGRALDFNRIWDGFDLVSEFTRRCYIGLEEEM